MGVPGVPPSAGGGTVPGDPGFASSASAPPLAALASRAAAVAAATLRAPAASSGGSWPSRSPSASPRAAADSVRPTVTAATGSAPAGGGGKVLPLATGVSTPLALRTAGSRAARRSKGAESDEAGAACESPFGWGACVVRCRENAFSPPVAAAEESAGWRGAACGAVRAEESRRVARLAMTVFMPIDRATGVPTGPAALPNPAAPDWPAPRARRFAPAHGARRP